MDRKTTCFIPNLLCLWCDLLSNRLEDMESGKRPTEEALDESMPPHQRLHHQENATRDLGQTNFHLNALQDAFITLKHGANSTQVRLAKAEARIMGGISTTFLHFLLVLSSRS